MPSRRRSSWCRGGGTPHTCAGEMHVGRNPLEEAAPKEVMRKRSDLQQVTQRQAQALWAGMERDGRSEALAQARGSGGLDLKRTWRGSPPRAEVRDREEGGRPARKRQVPALTAQRGAAPSAVIRAARGGWAEGGGWFGWDVWPLSSWLAPRWTDRRGRRKVKSRFRTGWRLEIVDPGAASYKGAFRFRGWMKATWGGEEALAPTWGAERDRADGKRGERGPLELCPRGVRGEFLKGRVRPSENQRVSRTARVPEEELIRPLSQRQRPSRHHVGALD